MFFFIDKLAEILASNSQEFSLKNQTEHFWSCRVQANQICHLTDLCGLYCQVRIQNLNKNNRQINFQVLKQKFLEETEYWSQIKVQNQSKNGVLFQAQIDKIYLEKLVETLPFNRFNEIFIFKSDFSAEQNINWERLDKILTRSCGQAELWYKPKISFLTQSALEKLLLELKPVILDCETEGNLTFEPKKNEQARKTANSPVDLSDKIHPQKFLIGAEGGFSVREKKYFQDIGLEFLNLGQIIYPAWLAHLMI